MREKILELIQTNPNLPPLPEILFGLQKIIDDPDCEVEDVYRLIKTDPVLSGRLITLANSALFGTGRDETRDLQDAVVRLGMKQVMDLVYALELPKTFKKVKLLIKSNSGSIPWRWLLSHGRWLKNCFPIWTI